MKHKIIYRKNTINYRHCGVELLMTFEMHLYSLDESFHFVTDISCEQTYIHMAYVAGFHSGTDQINNW